jgi:hypothetical protein
MSAPSHIGLAPQPWSPKVDRSFRGLRAAFSAAPAAGGLAELRIGAVCLLDDAQVEALGGATPAEALVLTVVSGFQAGAVNPLGDVQVFEDDYRRRDGLWLSYLDFRLADFVALHPVREYYATLSVGTWLSNTLHIPALQT